jgi:hypothetical protein
VGSVAAGGSTPDTIPLRSLCIARLGRGAPRRPARSPVVIAHDRVVIDARTGYEVRIADGALKDMRRISSAGPTRGEAGGVLLGQFDLACKVIWVSRACEHPSDAGDRRGLVSLIGFWDLSPDGSPVAFRAGRRCPKRRTIWRRSSCSR